MFVHLPGKMLAMVHILLCCSGTTALKIEKIHHYTQICLLHICNIGQDENVLVQKQKPFSNLIGLTKICFEFQM